MGEKSLFEEMLEAHVEAPSTRDEQRPVSAKEMRLARSLDRARAAAASKPVEQDLWRIAESRPSGPVQMCGFCVGDQFDLQHCSPEVVGRWKVIRIDPGQDGDLSRQLYAQRVTGEAGYVMFGERKLRDAIHAGLLIPRN